VFWILKLQLPLPTKPEFETIPIHPSIRTFHNAYQVFLLPYLTSKARETAFQSLNSTVWTNNKAYKLRMRVDQTVTDAGKLKQWNIYYANAWITLNFSGFAFAR
jgi:hypothetical protein